MQMFLQKLPGHTGWSGRNFLRRACDHDVPALRTTTGAQIIQTFQQLNAEGYTVVIITHETRVSEAVKRVIRLEDGRLVDDGLKGGAQ